MKVYIIYDKDGWEILGIEKACSTRAKAEAYLANLYLNYVKFQEGKGIKALSLEEWCEQLIVEIEVE